MTLKKLALGYITALMLLIFFSPALVSGATDCVVPVEDMQVSSSVVLCAGTYDLGDADGNGAITISADNVVVDCDGAVLNGSRLKDSIGVSNRGFDGVEIRSCEIKNYYHGIRFFSGADNGVISDNILVYNTMDGISIDGSSGNMIAGNNLSFNSGEGTMDGTGVYISSADNNTVSNNVMHSNRYDGVWLHSSSHNIVEGNEMSGGTYAVDLDGKSNFNVIRDNTASRNTYGIYVWADDNLVVFNKAENNKYYGIACDHSARNKVYNNTLRDNGANVNYGIYVRHCRDSEFKNNLVTGSPHGMYFYSSNDNRVYDSTIGSASKYGVYFRDGSANNTFVNTTYGSAGFADKNSSLVRRWPLQVEVSDYFLPVEIARIKITDGHGKTVFEDVMGSDGIVQVDLIEYEQNQSDRIEYNPYTVDVLVRFFHNSTQINVTGPVSIKMMMLQLPELLLKFLVVIVGATCLLGIVRFFYWDKIMEIISSFKKRGEG